MILKQEIEAIVGNRVGDSKHQPNTVRCVIWTGLMFDISGAVYNCPGYLKDERAVYVCLKDRFVALRSNRWKPSNLNQVVEQLKKKLGSSKDGIINKEISKRTSEVSGELKQAKTAIPPDQSVGKITSKDSTIDRAISNLWIDLAFFDLEVFKVDLAPNEGIGLDRAAPGGIVSNEFCEVMVTLNSSKFEVSNARLVRSPNIDPITEVRVPTGAGENIIKYRERRRLNIPIADVAGGRVRISRGLKSFNSLYSHYGCPVSDIQISKDGDVWVEGVRSSLSRGLYEVWTDDINMGPMLRISRQKVHESAARYYRDVQAAQQRYAGERDNPLSSMMASTSITPIRVYIEDWFGDPSFYVGLANFLMALSSGLEDKDKYKKVYYDLGTFDYGRIYNRYDGVTV